MPPRDPYSGSYVLADPQSLNRYAYVRGGPLGARDPSGLDPCPLCNFYTWGEDSTSITVTATIPPLLGEILGPLGLGFEIFELGKDFGLWGTGPTFHGSVAASQSGKNVPAFPENHICGDFVCSPDGHQLGEAPGGGAIHPANGLMFGAVGGVWGLADGLAAGTTEEGAALAARGGLGGVSSFSSSTNAAGGEVFTSIGNISQSDFAGIVNNGLYKGEVNILTGVHGYADLSMENDLGLYEEDFVRWGNTPGVNVYNITTMTPEEVGGVLNGSGTIIGAFCNSGVCLAFY